MAHYYDEYQHNRLKLKKVKAIIRGKSFDFYSGSGIFSKNQLDKGTALLAEYMFIDENSFVLDLGCGIGILGIAIGKLFPSCNVIMSDINRRAVELARMNIKLNMVNNVDVRQGNLFEPIKERFNAIIINPPMKAGYKVCFEIIEKSRDFLLEKGTFQLVALHNKGGSRLAEKMKDIFGNVKVIAMKSGYRVYLSVS